MSEEKRGMLSAGRPSNVRKSATLAVLDSILDELAGKDRLACA